MWLTAVVERQGGGEGCGHGGTGSTGRPRIALFARLGPWSMRNGGRGSHTCVYAARGAKTRAKIIEARMLVVGDGR